MQWYYYTNDIQHGPVDESEMRRLINEGILSSEDLIWNESFAKEWVTVGSVAKFSVTYADTPASPEAIVQTPDPSTAETPNPDLMQQARVSLKGNWGIAIGATLIYVVITYGLAAIDYIGWVLSIAVEGPLKVGLTMIFLTIMRNKEQTDINLLFKGFHNALTAIAAYLLVTLYALLWTLLFIVPGIAAALSYAMTFYIIADNPEIKARDAIARSRAMMYGRRLKLLGLLSRFFGWFLLGLVSCGIAFLFVSPYLSAAMAQFYEDIRNAPDNKTASEKGGTSGHLDAPSENVANEHLKQLRKVQG